MILESSFGSHKILREGCGNDLFRDDSKAVNETRKKLRLSILIEFHHQGTMAASVKVC